MGIFDELANNNIELEKANEVVKKVIQVNVEDIEENELNEKMGLENDLTALFLKSIQIHGIKTPLKLYKKENGKYKILGGHRRLKGAIANNLKYVPAIIEDNENEELDHSIDNFSRDLTIRQKNDIKNVIKKDFEKHGIKINDIELAEEMEVGQTTITRLNKYDKLSEDNKKIIDNNEINFAELDKINEKDIKSKKKIDKIINEKEKNNKVIKEKEKKEDETTNIIEQLEKIVVAGNYDNYFVNELQRLTKMAQEKADENKNKIDKNQMSLDEL